VAATRQNNLLASIAEQPSAALAPVARGCVAWGAVSERCRIFGMHLLICFNVGIANR
jgi:hypothetical protein